VGRNPATAKPSLKVTVGLAPEANMVKLGRKRDAKR
jgi:hypothetical protein